MTRPRQPDAMYPDFHLLEELSKPQACLTACRIAVFVYHDEMSIREVVLAGHAELDTCSSATAILVETAKRLGDGVEWMLTCGAAYFRVLPPNRIASGIQGAMRAQQQLGNMIRLLQEVADEKGLIDIVHRDWYRLTTFRALFLEAAATPAPQLLLPERSNEEAQIIDYVPVMTGSGVNAKPVTFQLEGWDFDCPEFQAVADIHLRNLQRELLRDALRRRRTYRGWFKELTEEWVHRLSWLPAWQAEQAVIELPPPADNPQVPPQEVSAVPFLKYHAGRFLDRGQSWHQELAWIADGMPHDQMSAADLDREIRPQTVTEFDFHRGIKNTRPGTEDDSTFTTRDRVRQSDPRMISTCLMYIRDMNTIIGPYEALRTGARDQPGEALDAMISRQIVMESMVRGWPSVFLADEADRKVFAKWSDKKRPRIWSILAKQAKAQGVALDILFEDNVVYDVRFTDDLGCVIRPLMLVDDFTHAQLHGSRAGASVAIPLWTRKSPQAMPARVLSLGRTNSERAVQLVRLAAGEIAGACANVRGAAELLRQALACHPAEAGRLILQEWLRRLGRDTRSEFERARQFVTAGELLHSNRFGEAGAAIAKYLRDEPKPVADAYIIAALAALHRDDDARVELQRKANDRQRLARRHDELLERLRAQEQRGEGVLKRDIDILKSLGDEVDRLTGQINVREHRIREETDRIKALIGQALQQPDNLEPEHHHLAAAAVRARDLLQATLEREGLYVSSDAATARYTGLRGIVETRGLLDILLELGRIAYHVKRAPNETRRQTVADMERLSTALWLPGEIESDLRKIAEEFAKGDWDRLQSLNILAVLRDAMGTCQSRIEDLLRSRAVTGVSLKETIATRIHYGQVIAAKYKIALDNLLTAKIAFAGAIDQPWTVLNDELEELADDARFVLEGDVLLVESDGKRTPLLQATGMSAADRELVEEVLADETLLLRISRFGSVAESLLAVDVEPRREWRTWRDVMTLLVPELIVALSSFNYAANLMPDHSPPTVKAVENADERVDQLEPRSYPVVDWQWSQLGGWKKLAGSCRREALEF